MEILGIGTQELIFILLIAIIVLGPKDMQKAGKTVGRWLNRMMRSDGWRAFQRASREIRNLPTNLMREANLDDLRNMDQEIRNSIDPRPPRPPRPQPPANQAAPPPQQESANPEPPADAEPGAPPPEDGPEPRQE